MANNIDEAKEKLKEALALQPDHAEAITMLSDIQRQKQNQVILKEQAEANAQRFTGSLAAAFEGKNIATLGALIGRAQKWLKANPE